MAKKISLDKKILYLNGLFRVFRSKNTTNICAVLEWSVKVSMF